MIIINIKNEEEEEAFGQKSIKILRIIRHIIFEFFVVLYKPTRHRCRRPHRHLFGLS